MISSNLLEEGERVFSRYEVVRLAGVGGMQQVYLAKGLVIGREVALKVPIHPSAEKRFRRSAVVSAKINHPNVAKTLDYIETEESAYLVEEFIAGQDIKEGLLIPCRVIDPYLVAKIFHHLAKGVSASHSAGVIHRDLKPSNVMFSGGLTLKKIKITDFGIAKMAQEEIENAVKDASSISASATVVGALPYMAPELIEEAPKAGKASDIWALGAMMYELISGKKPFGSGLSAIRNILEDPAPDKPNEINKNLQFSALGNEIYELIICCLNKDPESRPSAQELVSYCENFCYTVIERNFGVVVHEHEKYNWGHILSDDSEEVFFHFDSVYGDRPKEGDRVYFSAFSGQPKRRAHPVVKLQTSDI